MPGPSTACVHGGEEPEPVTGAVTPPVHLSTTFLYPELADGSRAPYIYSRYENPTVEAVESKLALLEQADSSLLFASGMAAIQATFQAFVRPGDTVAVQRGGYGGTAAYLADELAPWGVRVEGFDAHGDGPVPPGAKLVWLESVTNPLLRVADVEAWADRAHDAGALLGVDATFASPMLQRPLGLGADVAMHSATKYLGGHADLTAGAVSFANVHRGALWQRRRNLGGVPDPHAAYLLGRGMKTLALRMERHCSNALALATACEGLEGVAAVHYPGLASHPDHEVARRMLADRGGMVTIDLGSLAAAQRFRRSLRLVAPAASLGGVESLASLPAETSHAYTDPARRRAEGIGDGLVRISVGIEDAQDIVDDVAQAVAAARAASS